LASTVVLVQFAAPHHAQVVRDSRPLVRTPTRFVGRVLAADGSPVHGAEVETSAGGKVRSAADGSFELAVDVPPESASVELTAVLERASGGLVASASLVPPSLSSLAYVGALVVRPAERPPRWLPGTGPRPGTDGTVEVFAVCDDGRGPALVMGGTFTSAGGTT